MFFRHFLHAYECIVLLDPHSGRRFNTRDVKVLIKDLEILEVLFTVPHSEITTNMLPKVAVKQCVDPLRRIITTLYTMDTKTLIRSQERLRREAEGQELPITPTLPPKHVSSLCIEGINLNSTIALLEREESMEQQKLSSDHRRIHNITHPLDLFQVAMEFQAPETNPFLADLQSPVTSTEELALMPWQERWVINVIAKRAGYGHPSYYEESTASTLLKSIGKSIRPKRPKEPTLEEQDLDAITFMKSIAVKKFLGLADI
jgi:hypothetical protein